MASRCLQVWCSTPTRIETQIEYYWMEGEPKDDGYLRERVLWRRLSVLVDALIININPMKKLPNGEEYQPHCEEEHSIWWASCKMIEASHPNRRHRSLLSITSSVG